MVLVRVGSDQKTYVYSSNGSGTLKLHGSVKFTLYTCAGNLDVMLVGVSNVRSFPECYCSYSYILVGPSCGLQLDRDCGKITNDRLPSKTKSKKSALRCRAASSVVFSHILHVQGDKLEGVRLYKNVRLALAPAPTKTTGLS